MEMTCHICKAEAVSRCYTCGELVCAEHGKGDTCPRCSGGFAAGDPRHDRIAVVPLLQKKQSGWWRPQQAEEYSPPACFVCQGLARRTCRNCQVHYCSDHAGSNGLCRECSRSANLGIYVMLGIVGLFGVVLFFNWLMHP